ncbi:hypothetical protein [Solidesulfovibrio sp.]
MADACLTGLPARGHAPRHPGRLARAGRLLPGRQAAIFGRAS